MKYKDINKDQARKCCKDHRYKDNKGIHHNCEVCPLRREREITKKDGTKEKKNLFCWFVLKTFYDEIETESELLEQENIQYEEEWNKYINKLETEQ